MKIIKNNKSILVKYYNKFFNRLRGFMFKRKIDYCICFPRCNSIHTFFMFKNIDVIMADKDYKILYIFKKLRPFRIILPKKNVYYTFEFPVNRFKFNINEKIKVE